MQLLSRIKNATHRLLDHGGLYARMEWSPPHRLFVRFNNPAYEEHQRAGMSFYRQFMPKGSLVFDIGANAGAKSEVFLWLGATVVAAEPDRRCVATLRRRFMLCRDFHLLPAAVGASDGYSVLFTAEAGSAYNTLSAKWRDETHTGADSHAVSVPTTTLDAMIAKWGKPAFIKIDVEGHELSVLRGLTTAVQALSFEANLPTFREETLECLSRLHAIDKRYRFNLTGDISMGLRLSNWMTEAEMRDVVHGETDCIEIFARLSPP
jgi:FkbM family methyltransferase